MASVHCLICRVGASLCALPTEQVVEVMRPLPVEPVANTPEFVLGVSVVRGEPMPVIDARRLLEGSSGMVGRFVSLQVAGRGVVLAVSDTLRAVELDVALLAQAPPLLRDQHAVTAIGNLDRELLLGLELGRVVSATFGALGALAPAAPAEAP